MCFYAGVRRVGSKYTSGTTWATRDVKRERAWRSGSCTLFFLAAIGQLYVIVHDEARTSHPLMTFFLFVPRSV